MTEWTQLSLPLPDFDPCGTSPGGCASCPMAAAGECTPPAPREDGPDHDESHIFAGPTTQALKAAVTILNLRPDLRERTTFATLTEALLEMAEEVAATDGGSTLEHLGAVLVTPAAWPETGLRVALIAGTIDL